MLIDVLTNDGSPLGCSLSTLLGTEPGYLGVGGAEMALLTLCELWQKRGDTVRLYNDPRPTWNSPFEQHRIIDFDPKENRDVLIVFRSPNARAVIAKAGLKTWFSTDQFTTGRFKDFRPYMDKVVLISQTHHEYFSKTYGITDGIVIDLPVRVWEYENRDIEKVKNRFIFTSVPARGLDIMLDIWPEIKKVVPDASLVITSDYRLWNCGAGNEQFLAHAKGLEGIEYLGAVTRPRLVEEQLKAELNVYTCNYEELFCIAVAESQVAGIIPITSDVGALKTTNMGFLVPGDPVNNKKEFIDETIEVVNDRSKMQFLAKDLQKMAIDRFHPNNILRQWDQCVFQ